MVLGAGSRSRTTIFELNLTDVAIFIWQTIMESREVTIKVPKVIMEDVEITYQVPAMETRTQTVQRPKTVM